MDIQCEGVCVNHVIMRFICIKTIGLYILIDLVGLCNDVVTGLSFDLSFAITYLPCSSVGNSHRSASPRPTTLEEDWELFVNFSLILCLWFEIQDLRAYNFFDWISNTALQCRGMRLLWKWWCNVAVRLNVFSLCSLTKKDICDNGWMLLLWSLIHFSFHIVILRICSLLIEMCILYATFRGEILWYSSGWAVTHLVYQGKSFERIWADIYIAFSLGAYAHSSQLLPLDFSYGLTHWGQVTHIFVSKLNHHWFK